jgi:two-component system sensor histidine kinase YesM
MLIPTTIMTTVVLVVSRNIIEEQMIELAKKNLLAAQAAIEQHLFFVGEMTTLAYTNPTIQNILSSKPSDNTVENIINSRLLDEALNGHVMSNYFSQNSFPIYPRIYLINRPELSSRNPYSRVHDISQLEEQYWYQQMENRNLMYTAIISDRKLIVARKLFDLRNIDVPKYSALLTLEINIQYFNDLLHSYKSSYNSSIYIINEYDTIVLGSDNIATMENKLIQSMDHNKPLHGISKIGKNRAIITADKLRYINWIALSITYLNGIDLPERVFSVTVLAILLACILMALITALRFADTLSDPIIALVHSMNSIGDNLDINIEYKGHDEFKELIEQYKHMMRQIHELINKLYISEMNKQKAELDAKNAELQALQTQINPHFLYNTLDSINLYAIKYNAPVICEMIDSLANLFRYTLNSSGAITTLDREINHTRNYLKLQSLRMGENLRYSFQIPGELRNVRIVKLVLQPLAENSIHHGFTGKRGPLEIIISARREEGNTVISIRDNGAGADINEMDEILASEPGDNVSTSFAISNVHRRLWQTFGEQYGLRFIRNEEAGLTSIITIPTVWKEGDDA